MNKINLFTSIFGVGNDGSKTSSGIHPTDFRYVHEENNFDGITIYTEEHVLSDTVKNVNSKYNIGWLCESKSIVRYDVDKIKELSEKYDYIFTHDKSLIDYNPNKFLYVIPASWREHFPDKDVNFYENKSKLVSFAYSHKRMTKGHNYRHEVAPKLLNKVDLMGTGCGNPFPPLERILAYKDYMFTIIIENDDYDYYFSEKIIEPYWAGTIPIYWGGSHDDSQINKVFNLNMNGIITFKNTEELLEIINSLSKELYDSKKEAVLENYRILTDHTYRKGSEEFFYEKYLKKFFTEGNLDNLKSCVI